MPSAELTEDGLGIILTCQMAENHLAEQVPGIGYRDKEQVWYVRASWPACLVLRYLFGTRLELGPRLLQWGADQRYARDRAGWLRMMVNTPASGDIPDSLVRLLFTQMNARDGLSMFDFQSVGSVWLALQGAALEADEMGSGKTIQALAAARAVQNLTEGALPALVICPSSMMETWRREILKWWPGVSVVIVAGAAGKRRKIIEAGADIMIISWATLRYHTRLAAYSGLRAKKCATCGGERDLVTGETVIKETVCETHERELNACHFKTVIADEAHRAKDPRAKQTRAWWHLAWHAPVRYALTGTPLESSVGDLWSILHGLDPVAFPGRSKFLDLFATVSRNFFGGMEVLGLKPEARELFYSILDLYMRRLPKAVTLPFLPPMMPPVYRYPEMGARQQKAYDQMTEDMLAQLPELLVADNPLAKLAHQVSLASASGTMVGKVCRVCKGNGQVPGDAWTSYSWVDCERCQGTGKVEVLQLEEPSCKIDDLIDFLGDHGGKPLVVWTVRTQLANLTAARLAKEKVTYALFTGAQDAAAKQAAIDRFQAGQIQVFLANIAAGNLGITLTRADTAYFMQRHPSLIYNSQAENRIHRIGSERHDAINTVISLTAGTVEARIEELFLEKGERFEEVVRDRTTLEWLVKGEGSCP